jgi:hypothetical protein
MTPKHFIVNAYVNDVLIGSACFFDREEGETWADGFMTETEVGAEAMGKRKLPKPWTI